MTGTDFHVVNTATGRTVYTSPHLDYAKREAAVRACRGETVEVQEVTVTVTRRRVYRPRAPKVVPVDLAIPEIGAAA